MATYQAGYGSGWSLTFDGATGTAGVVADETRWVMHEEADVLPYPYITGSSAIQWELHVVGMNRWSAVVDFVVDTAKADDFWDSTNTRPGGSVTVHAQITANDKYTGTMSIVASDIVTEPHGIIRGTLWLTGSSTITIGDP